MKRRRIALIGLGMAVTPHAKSLLDLADRVEVAHAFSPSAARRAAFGAALPVPALRRASRRSWPIRAIEAVAILTPPNTHLELARRAARRPASTSCWRSRSRSRPRAPRSWSRPAATPA